MEDGESDQAGSGSVGGNESQGGGGYGGYGHGLDSGTASYSQEAMNSALAASDSQAMDNNMEYGLSMDPNRNAQGVGTMMNAYTGGYPEAASTMINQNRRTDFKNQNPFGMYDSFKTAGQVGQDRGYMGQALKEKVAEDGTNFIGGLTGGMIGGAAGGPIGGLVGMNYGGNIGTNIMNRENDLEMGRATGLVSNLTGSPEGPMTKEDTDSMVWKLLQNRGRV
jgi:hypothetical protein